jgi:hypothetical protein
MDHNGELRFTPHPNPLPQREREPFPPFEKGGPGGIWGAPSDTQILFYRSLCNTK